MATATSSPAATALVRAIMRLAESVATPLLPADYLDLVAPLRATAQLRGRVVSVTPETRHAATVQIRPGRSWQGHRPGQYIRAGIDVEGVRHWRAYSLTSQSTSTDGLLSITVKAIPNGKVSTTSYGCCRRAHWSTSIRHRATSCCPDRCLLRRSF